MTLDLSSVTSTMDVSNSTRTDGGSSSPNYDNLVAYEDARDNILERLKSDGPFNLRFGYSKGGATINKTPLEELSPRRQDFLSTLCPTEVFGYKNWAVAGGSLRNLIYNRYPIKDIDLFALGTLMPSDVRKIFAEKLPDLNVREDVNKPRIFEFDWNFNPVQVIVPRKATTIHGLFGGFDFMNACMGFDGKDLYWTNDAITAISKKEVIMNSFRKPLPSLQRLARYHRDYGWNVGSAIEEIAYYLKPSLASEEEYNFC